MAKQKATMSIDPHLWQQFKNETNSASQTVENLIKTWLNTQGNDVSELKNREDELVSELDELKEQQKRVNERISDIEGELDTVRSAIEEANKEENRLNSAVAQLKPKVVKERRKKKDLEQAVKSVSTTQAYHNWLGQLDVESKKLKQKLKEEVSA